MSAAFTPGPWYRGLGDRLPHGVLDPKTHRTIAACNGDLPTGDNYIIQNAAEREANARLIAAAPELYEALDWLLGSVGIDSCAYDPERYSKAERALAKARGEQ